MAKEAEELLRDCLYWLKMLQLRTIADNPPLADTIKNVQDFLRGARNEREAAETRKPEENRISEEVTKT